MYRSNWYIYIYNEWFDQSYFYREVNYLPSYQLTITPVPHNWFIIGFDNGVSPNRRQAII